MSSRYQTGSVLSHFIDKLVSSEYMFVTSVSRLFSPTHQNPIYEKYTFSTAGKPATQESSLDVFCHVIFDVNIDVMDVRGRPQEFVAL